MALTHPRCNDVKGWKRTPEEARDALRADGKMGSATRPNGEMGIAALQARHAEIRARMDAEMEAAIIREIDGK